MNYKALQEKVTNKIIKELEAGDTAPWLKMWAGDGVAKNIKSGATYQGFNQLILGIAGFDSAYWLTFKQCEALGGKVKKGSKGTQIAYASSYNKTTENSDGTTSERSLAFMRVYTVFNVEQCDGIEAPKEGLERVKGAGKNALIDAFVENTGAKVQMSNKACYIPSIDVIKMPPKSHWNDTDSYYSTLAHELTHWTGEKDRLDRLDLKNKKGYAFEELVAEFGNAFLCKQFNIAPEARHAGYLKSWLEALKNDYTYLPKAAAQAGKAHVYLNKLQNKEEKPTLATQASQPKQLGLIA